MPRAALLARLPDEFEPVGVEENSESIFKFDVCPLEARLRFNPRESLREMNGLGIVVMPLCCEAWARTEAYVDGAQIVMTDILASNGVIHVIDAVILPPAE